MNIKENVFIFGRRWLIFELHHNFVQEVATFDIAVNVSRRGYSNGTLYLHHRPMSTSYDTPPRTQTCCYTDMRRTRCRRVTHNLFSPTSGQPQFNLRSTSGQPQVNLSPNSGQPQVKLSLVAQYFFENSMEWWGLCWQTILGSSTSCSPPVSSARRISRPTGKLSSMKLASLGAGPPS